MVSSATIVAFAAALGACVQNVNAHGYMYIPLAEFTDSVTAAWIVQIDPQWDGDWQDCESSDDSDTCLVEVYQTLKESNGYDDIRTLLDSDTDLYGADCGYTDPDADPKDPPTDGTATFSRGMVHPGPCEIWLDDTLVLTDDNCEYAYGDGTQETTTIFTPMDYSSCSEDGCMLYFYWLAFQGVDGEYVWQVYKDCVPLTGPTGSSTSTTTTTSSDDTTTSTADEATTTTSATTDSTDYTTSSATTEDTTSTTSATTDSTDYTASSATTDSTDYTASSATTDSTDYTTSSATTESTDFTASSGMTGGSGMSEGTGMTESSSMGETADAQSSTMGGGDQGGDQGGNQGGWSGGFGGMRTRKLRQ